MQYEFHVTDYVAPAQTRGPLAFNHSQQSSGNLGANVHKPTSTTDLRVPTTSSADHVIYRRSGVVSVSVWSRFLVAVSVDGIVEMKGLYMQVPRAPPCVW